MPVLTQDPTLGDLLKYELNANYCRETVTLKSGTNFALGAVLGKLTADGKYTLSPASAADGSETAVAVLLEAADATAADTTGLIAARGPVIVSKAQLAFDGSVNDTAKKAVKHTQLAAAGLVVRETA